MRKNIWFEIQKFSWLMVKRYLLKQIDRAYEDTSYSADLNLSFSMERIDSRRVLVEVKNLADLVLHDLIRDCARDGLSLVRKNISTFKKYIQEHIFFLEGYKKSVQRELKYKKVRNCYEKECYPCINEDQLNEGISILEKAAMSAQDALVKGEYAESQVNQDFTSIREKWCNCFDCFKLKKIWKMTLEHDLEKTYVPGIADAIARVLGEISKSEMQINFYRQFCGSIEKSLYFFVVFLEKFLLLKPSSRNQRKGFS